MSQFTYDADNFDDLLRDVTSDMFDMFRFENALSLKTDANKALAIALFGNIITNILMDQLNVHPKEEDINA